jgi:hypothetical protein
MVDKLERVLGHPVILGPAFKKVGENFVFENGTTIEAGGTRLWSLGENQEIVEWESVGLR